MGDRMPRHGVYRALASRTLLDLLTTPKATIAALFMLLGSGIPFLYPPEYAVVPDFSFRSYASRIPLLASLFFPAICSGLWDSERKEGTLDLLLSYPASDAAIVLSKSFPAFLVFAATLALTAPLALSLQSLQDASGVTALTGTLIPGYLMLLLHAFSLSAFSSYVALRFSGTVVPTLASFATIASLSVSHIIPQAVNLHPWIARAFVNLSSSWRLDSAFRGVIDMRDVLFFSFPAALFTALSVSRISRVRRGS